MLLTLAVLAVLEVATLGTLLVNLATAHHRAVTQTMGPVHGAVYLCVAVIVLLAPGFRPRDRLLGCLPVVGGLLALHGERRIR
ncbi:hypothetical protein [Nocardioides sp. cx-173]|uniref:hypothetical protein n=1 Tax=Nocardioides sp. cx-173 TaxID=2898796 RepID=UPI001E36817D|nr:hypothetical protein [Nocardioides sp. cx-173]MCD4523894.1 hypothetical protein [Nocardioides sp. cx-173]UGB41787.1 hypothetical protein LQ940_20860 [Nocardioides sp. cx-173]